MALIERSLLSTLLTHKPPKAMVIFGPRSVGKTTLLQQADVSLSAAYYSGDRAADVKALNMPSTNELRNFLLQGKTVVIEEAQRIPDIGLLLKRLVDINSTLEKPVKIFATGSSSFELASGVKESALGRIKEIQMWPLSLNELAAHYGWGYVQTHLERFLVFGSYPEVVANLDRARVTLSNLGGDLMYRDILALEQVRKPGKLSDLMALLALRIGQEITYESLGRELGMHSQTVERYIDVLEKCFLIRRCNSFSRNLDSEIKKGKKIYFCDVGLRNAILDNFETFSGREDRCALWENFVFMERLKLHNLNRDYAKMYFWRTSHGRSSKVDFIEVVDGQMTAIECQLSKDEKAKPGETFLSAYPECRIRTAMPFSVMQLCGSK